MTLHHLISIVIPTYNHRRWISEAIDSALAQTYPDCEIIAVDDGSTDGTGKFLRERYGDRIRYVYQENRGRGAARNHGVRLARGEYIQFLDADDLILPEKIHSQTVFLDTHPEYAAVYCHARVFYEDAPDHSWDHHRQEAYCSGNILKSEIHEPFLLPIMVLVRRVWVDKVGGFDETLRSNEDWDLWLRIAHAGGRFAYLPGPAMALHRARRKETARASVHLRSGVQVLVKLRDAIGDRSQRRSLEIDRAIGQWMFGYGKALADEGGRLRGVRQMVLSLALDRRSLNYKLLSILVLALFPPAQGNNLLKRAQAAKSRLLPKAGARS